jgi:putative hydrolase of HD superfamily
MGEVELRGRRIKLRDWQEPDLEGFAYWLGPDHRWHELDGPYYPRPGPDEIQARVLAVRRGIETGDLPTPRTSLAIADLATDELIGRVVWYWQSQETDWLSLGITIFDPEHWSRGLGFEALGLWGDYLWYTMPAIVRLDLRTWSGNLGMIHLAEKLGFREDARFRKARLVGGTRHDSLGYGVLREEWRQRYPDGFAAHLAASGVP